MAIVRKDDAQKNMLLWSELHFGVHCILMSVTVEKVKRT